jgi:uncharacterized SAM-binding protein YcdF (DUF218 family)
MTLRQTCFHFFSLLLTTFLLGFGLFAFTLPSPIDNAMQKTDAAIVLTGGEQRVAEGLNMLTQDDADYLLITGVHPSVKINELLVMHKYPSALADKITLDYNAIDTYGNALEASKWVKSEGYNAVALITSDYHMPRALLFFRHLMPNVVIMPHVVQPDVLKKARWWQRGEAVVLLTSAYIDYLLAWPHMWWRDYRHAQIAFNT